MLSGGDLDGDDYFVIWDPKLLPAEWSHPPMNYSAPKPLNEPKASTAKSLASFFVLFMKNDRLPLIAHAHLATADYEIEGPKHRKCETPLVRFTSPILESEANHNDSITGLQLAELHSTAVDYVKTGVPAEWDKRLDPRKYPHFMEKPANKSYHSSSVLGKLYDMVGKGEFNSRENYMLPFDNRILKRYQLRHELLKEGRKIKSQYDIGMRRVMAQLEIRTEFEVWTSFVLSKPKVGSDYKVQEKVGREVAGLKKQFRDLCLKTVQEHNFDKLEFVAAMYTVTWEEMRIALYQARQPHVLPDGTVGLRRVTARSMPLISFPWLFPNELGRIAVGGERLPAGQGFIAKPTSTKLPKPRASISLGVPEDPELDFLAAMDCTKVSDGQVIHRGETLHLFRHEDDSEEAFYCNDDVAGSSSPADATSEEPSEGQVLDKSPTSEMTPGDFPVLLDLGTALDSEECNSSSFSSVMASVLTTSASNPAGTALQMTGIGGGLTMPDLLSSDTDARSDFSTCLTPDRVLTPRQLDAVTAMAPLDSSSAVAGGEEKMPWPESQSNTWVPALPWDRINRVSPPSPGPELSPDLDLEAPLEYITLRIGNRLFPAATGLTCFGPLRQPFGSVHNMPFSSRDLETRNSGWGEDTAGSEAVSTPPRSPKDEKDATESSKEDAEYEEEAIEVGGETALERAKRLA
jgi:RNA-dependent RNA polymerase